jgi:rubrerythrin
MTKKYIDADAFIRFIDCGHLRPPTELCFSEKDVVDMINKLPAADVRENVHGNWITETNHGLGVHTIRCDNCGHCEVSISTPNFCPNCGADMRKPCTET